ncbi:MAG: transporter [Pseudohongiella sp.]|nr:MAG: transporter [Pseudohongiella sp.]
MKQLFKLCAIPLTFTIMATTSYADHEENGALQDAWLDGKLGTIVIFNEHLNPFEIETDVVDGAAIVTGKVDSPIQKSLMTELALGVEGIHEVDNRLVIVSEKTHADNKDESGAVSTMLDASITTAISTKILLKSEIDSSEIDVDTKDQTVTLNGTVASEIQSELVEQIAMNTFEVDEVVNKLEISNDS